MVEENNEYECSSCGSAVSQDAAKCIKCGLAFDEDDSGSENNKQFCPLCGRDDKMGKKAKLLYGHLVCRGCQNEFGNRRGVAFFIDAILWAIITLLIQAASVVIFPMVFGEITGDYKPLLGAFIFFINFAIIFCKDGFKGHSPGKALMDLQVMNESSGHPIGFGKSLIRNLSFLIPFVIFVIGFQVYKGYRVGDGLGNTKVIWKKYKDKAPFA